MPAKKITAVKGTAITQAAVAAHVQETTVPEFMQLPKGMQPEMRHYQSIHRSPTNPRKNAAAVPYVVESLREFGWRQPIVIDANDEICVGDTRYQAAGVLLKETGDEKWAWLPCVSAADLTEAQIIAYRAADNRTGEFAQWDDERLMDDFAQIADEGFNLTGMGFTGKELGTIQEMAEEKTYTKHLEDFDTMPAPKPRWILIAAPEDIAVGIMAKLKDMPEYGESKIQYSGDPALKADL